MFLYCNIGIPSYNIFVAINLKALSCGLEFSDGFQNIKGRNFFLVAGSLIHFFNVIFRLISIAILSKATITHALQKKIQGQQN